MIFSFDNYLKNSRVELAICFTCLFLGDQNINSQFFYRFINKVSMHDDALYKKIQTVMKNIADPASSVLKKAPNLNR